MRAVRWLPTGNRRRETATAACVGIAVAGDAQQFSSHDLLGGVDRLGVGAGLCGGQLLVLGARLAFLQRLWGLFFVLAGGAWQAGVRLGCGAVGGWLLVGWGCLGPDVVVSAEGDEALFGVIHKGFGVSVCVTVGAFLGGVDGFAGQVTKFGHIPPHIVTR